MKVKAISRTEWTNKRKESSPYKSKSKADKTFKEIFQKALDKRQEV